MLEFKNAIDYLPDDPEAHYQLGLAYVGAGDAQAAMQQFEKVIGLDPKHAGAQLKLAEWMGAQSDAKLVLEAEQRARAILSVQPQSVEGLAVLGLTELRLGKPNDAKQHLLEALQKAPGNLRASMTLARMRVAQKDLAGAEELLRKAAAENQSAESAVVLGRFYVMVGRRADAETQFRRAAQRDPKDVAGLLDLAALLRAENRKLEAEQTYKLVASFPDKSYQTVHARFLLEDGQYDAALRELKELAHEDPDNREVRFQLVAAELALNRVGEVEALLRQALRADPNDFGALFQSGIVFVMSGRYAEAEGVLEKAVQSRPNDAPAHYVLSIVYGNVIGAGSKQEQELRKALASNPQLLPARLALAQILRQSGKNKAAMQLIDQAQQSEKQTVPAIVSRNWSLLALGDLAQLRKGVRRGLEISKSHDLVLQDGLLKLHDKQFTEARESFLGLLNSDPEDARALAALASSYMAQQQPGLALQKVQGYVGQHPRSAQMQHLLGTLLLANGRSAEARVAFTNARAADPKSTAPELILAEMDAAEGRGDAARERLSDLLLSDSSNTAAHLLLADLETKAGQQSEAILHYRTVLGLDPTNIVALNNLAYYLANNIGQIDEALRLAQEASQAAPEDPGVEDTLGWVLYRKGIYHLALTHFENAVRKQRTPLRTYHLAMAYIKAGDLPRGRQTFEAATNKAPNLPEARMVRDLLTEATGSGQTADAPNTPLR